ncbi:MAG: hypothetical protein O2880_12400 [Proteobacteria bacterium]|nr:hypothetical protein [Pseudomonadota bacterium]
MSVIDGQERLRKIGRRVASETAISKKDRAFLSAALIDIADGKDAAAALGVKAKRGERKSKLSHEQSRKSKRTMQLALGWIAVAKLPKKEGGLGLTLEGACAKLGENDLKAFGLTEATLRSYWNRHPDNRAPEFEMGD